MTAIFVAVLVGSILKLTWELAASDAKDAQYAEQSADQYADRTHERIASTCANMVPAALAKCADEIIKSSHEAQTAQRDLAAQRGMHTWAIAMFWATAASVLVTGVGIYFVWRTLDANSQAVEQARIANRQADRANMQARHSSINANRIASIAVDTQRKIGQAQVRAYVTVTGAACSVDDITCQLWIEFENKGQSPAFNVVARVSASIRPPVSIRDQGFTAVTAEPQECVCEMISAGGKGKAFNPFFHTAFDPAAYDHLVDQRASLSFDFRMTWRDVFDAEHSLVGFLSLRDLEAGESLPDLPPMGRPGSKHWTAWMSAYNRDQRQNNILNAASQPRA